MKVPSAVWQRLRGLSVRSTTLLMGTTHFLLLLPSFHHCAFLHVVESQVGRPDVLLHLDMTCIIAFDP